MKSKGPPDFVGYENLIAFISEKHLHELDGDLVEIGAFMGGGTVKLAEYAQKYDRQLYVVDIFEPVLDQTISRSGESACSVYEGFLEGRSMWDVYREATAPFNNITTIREDSKKVNFGGDQSFIFGFIDGCHEETYVRSDFHLIWPHIVPGGVLGFHDWEYEDWPGVTAAVRKLFDEHRDEISEMTEIEGVYEIKSLMLIKKQLF